MSLTLSTNCGSGESLKCSERWGFSPKARQIRLIALWLMPVWAANRAGRPVGCARRALLQGLDDHPLDVFVGDLPRLARARRKGLSALGAPGPALHPAPPALPR